MLLPAAEIDEYHELLGTRLRDVLQLDAAMPVAPEDWREVMAGTDVFFQLLAAEPRHSAYYRPSKGPDAFVILPSALDAGEMSAGVGWHEQWKAANDDRFILQQLGWSFYWGDYRSQNRLFRAEWAPSSKEDSPYGQPHWHFDRRLIAEFAGSGDGDYAVQDIGLKRLHFPMAAWDNTGFETNCWRRMMDTIPILLEWAVKTLNYGLSELERLSKGEIVH